MRTNKSIVFDDTCISVYSENGELTTINIVIDYTAFTFYNSGKVNKNAIIKAVNTDSKDYITAILVAGSIVNKYRSYRKIAPDIERYSDINNWLGDNPVSLGYLIDYYL